MNVLFGAQGAILDVFVELDRRLRDKNVISETAYWISDAEYYFSNLHNFAHHLRMIIPKKFLNGIIPH